MCMHHLLRETASKISGHGSHLLNLDATGGYVVVFVVAWGATLLHWDDPRPPDRRLSQGAHLEQSPIVGSPGSDAICTLPACSAWPAGRQMLNMCVIITSQIAIKHEVK